MNGKVLTDDDGRLYTGQAVLYREKGVTALDVQRVRLGEPASQLADGPARPGHRLCGAAFRRGRRARQGAVGMSGPY